LGDGAKMAIFLRPVKVTLLLSTVRVLMMPIVLIMMMMTKTPVCYGRPIVFIFLSSFYLFFLT